MTSRASLAAGAALVALLGGCSSTAAPPSTAVVAFSDVHFDPFFDPSLFAALEAAPESQWAALFAGSGHSGPGQYGHTTNYVLLQRSLEAIRAQRPAFVIFGGDILVQDFKQMYFALKHAQDEAAMQAFALKATTFVVHQVRAALGTTPVYFTLGNWDDYAGSFGLQPDDPFLSDTAALFYDDLLLGTADRPTFEATYRTGGYYAAEVPGSGLVVLGVNTGFLAPQSTAGADAIALQLEWLDATLAGVEASGKRAWLVLHAPPGGDLATTGGDVDPQGYIDQPTMMLQAGPQRQLLTILAAHRGALAAAFTGHTHMDEYRIAVIAMQGIPGITSDMGNAPAFKTFTVSGSSALQDYVSSSLDLANPSAAFQPSYDFSSAYGLPAPLGPSLAALFFELPSSPAAQSTYRGSYGSGHAPDKPITDLDWPVYWCGIAFMGAQGLADCVNAAASDLTPAAIAP
jgi:sphingomyelin phosphodiesterase acid-like 3